MAARIIRTAFLFVKEKDMQVRKTEEKDLDAVMEIVKQGQEWLHSQNVPQWINGYPSRDDFHKDMEHGNSYVLEEGGKVLGVCCISLDGEDTYDVIDGKWLNEEPYVVIHRIAVAKDVKGKHLAHAFVEYASRLGCRNIRMDTHEQNRSMRAFLEREGFTLCGKITLHDGSPRAAYQKIIGV